MEGYVGSFRRLCKAMYSPVNQLRATGDGRNFASIFCLSFLGTRFSKVLGMICISGGSQDLPPSFYQVFTLIQLGMFKFYIGNLPGKNKPITSLSKTNEISAVYRTPGSMDSLFSDFVKEIWRGTSGARDYLGEIWGGFWWTHTGK